MTAIAHAIASVVTGETSSEVLPVVATEPVATLYDLYGIAPGRPVAVMPEELEDYLTVLGVSDEAQATLRRYYRWARLSVVYGQVTPEGEIRVWPRQEKIAELRQTSERNIRRHLLELEQFGLLRRGQAKHGQSPEVFLRPMGDLLKYLQSKPELQELLYDKMPSMYGNNLVPLEGMSADEFVHPLSVSIAESTKDEETEVDIWMEMQMTDTKNLLEAAILRAKAKTLEAAERKAAKPAHEKMGYGQEKKHSINREDTVPVLCEFLRSRIKDGLESVYQPTMTQKDLANMKALRDEIGAEQLRQVITTLCTPAKWQKIKAKCKINSAVPTPGILWGFRATIIPEMLQGTEPKRSGHAKPVPNDVIAIAKDAHDEENGAF